MAAAPLAMTTRFSQAVLHTDRDTAVLVVDVSLGRGVAIGRQCGRAARRQGCTFWDTFRIEHVKPAPRETWELTGRLSPHVGGTGANGARPQQGRQRPNATGCAPQQGASAVVA